MNVIFCAMMLAGVIAAAAGGNPAAAQDALLGGGAEAIGLCVSMAGAYALFGGVMGILRESGVTAALARALRAPLSRLFAFAPGEERALDDICVNLSANILGMGGAATPAGLSAMRTMAAAGAQDGCASAAMTMFLVINASSVQLLPTTMIALRAQAGAANPADIVWPTLGATAVSTLTGIALCKIGSGRRKTHG